MTASPPGEQLTERARAWELKMWKTRNFQKSLLEYMFSVDRSVGTKKYGKHEILKTSSLKIQLEIDKLKLHELCVQERV